MWHWLRGWFVKPDRAAVARQLQALLVAKGASQIVYDPALDEIRYSLNGGTQAMSVGNVYLDVLRAPRAQRKAIVQQFVAGVALDAKDEMPARYDDARARILPIVRTRADDAMGALTLARLATSSAQQASARLACQPLVGELVAALAYDSPHAMARVTEGKLAEWGCSFDQVMADALQNLRSLPEHGGWRDLGQGLWSGAWGDSYESSRLLLPDLIHRLGVPDPVALMPLRFTLLVASARNEAALAAMARTARQLITEHTRWLSLVPVQLTDAGWVLFTPPASCAADFADLACLDLADTYAGQKTLLDADFERQGLDIFVATATLAQRKADARHLTYAVWSEGVDALLPQTTMVIFIRQNQPPDAPMVCVPWDAMAAVVGPLLQPTDHVPVRYRVQAFPDAAQWQQLQTLTRPL